MNEATIAGLIIIASVVFLVSLCVACCRYNGTLAKKKQDYQALTSVTFS
jgi:hypothetical protein